VILVGNSAGYAALLWAALVWFGGALLLSWNGQATTFSSVVPVLLGPGGAIAADLVKRIRGKLGNLPERLFLPNLGAAFFFVPIWVLFPACALPGLFKMGLEDYWWLYLAALLTWAMASWFLEQRVMARLLDEREQLLAELIAQKEQLLRDSGHSQNHQ